MATMNDLTRRRNARDLWISRGHLAAAAALATTVSVVTFGVGFLVGRDVRVEPAPVAGPHVPDGALLELLARVEASATADGAVDVLTFPDALRGPAGGSPDVPAAAGEPLPVKMTAIGGAVAPGDRPPAGAFTVVVGRGDDVDAMRALQGRLTAMGLQAWVGAEIVDGVAAYRVAVGGYPTAEAATASLPIVQAAGLPGTVEALR
jgi:hypothetical protein